MDGLYPKNAGAIRRVWDGTLIFFKGLRMHCYKDVAVRAVQEPKPRSNSKGMGWHSYLVKEAKNPQSTFNTYTNHQYVTSNQLVNQPLHRIIKHNTCQSQ